MKGIRVPAIPAMDGIAEQERQAPSQERAASALRSPSLNLSVHRANGHANSPQKIGSRDEEHHQRLVSLGEKVGQLAHDIRNPLSSIEWFATLLGRNYCTDDERQEMAAHCIQAVRSLDQLVSNMLVFSAPIYAQRDCVDLLALLDDVELLAMYPLQKKNLTIQRHQTTHQAIMYGQESLLKQAFLNLLMNAIQASESGRTIEIDCRNESRLCMREGQQQSQEGMLLRIRDYGCGMSEEEISHMFHPFYSRRKGGTGLGLSIVKHVVHIHQGLIDITSQQGKGTTVDLFFPL